MLLMTIGLLPDATRTRWNRESSALERTGSGVSWRPNRPGTHEPWCWWCRCDPSPVSRNEAPARRPLA